MDDDTETLVEPSGSGGAKTQVDSTPPGDPNVTMRDLPRDAVEARGTAFTSRYDLEDLLGEGGMGEVHLCRDRRIGRRVALKTLRREVSSARALQRFQREVFVQGQLEHPAIVPVYDLGVDPEGRHFFTMKRVQGATLEEVIDNLRSKHQAMAALYTRRKLLTAFLQVCLAMDFAHRRGVIHRDLKPANIMLGDYGEVYVLDWGLARVVESQDAEPAVALDSQAAAATRPGSVQGTPGYMSPEQLIGREATPVSDVYALGSILFEMLTLTPLVPDGPIAQVIATTLAGAGARASERAPEADVPPELEAACIGATALRPGERTRSARELHDAVAAFLDGERDHELRQRMSQAHAQRARQLMTAQAAAEPTRRNALQEIGRSLALDPDNEEALDALADLLSEPPATLPVDVKTRMEASESTHIRKTARLGTFCYASLVFLVPFLLWAGLKDPSFLLPFYALVAASVAGSWLTMRALRPSPSMVLAVMIISNVMLLTTAPLVGALVLLPVVLIVNTIAFALSLPRAHRHVGVIASAVLCLATIALDVMGVFGAAYRFDADGMMVLARAIELRGAPTVTLLSVAFTWALVMGAFVAGRLKDELHSSEEQIQLYAWHLRALVPRRSGKLTARLEG